MPDITHEDHCSRSGGIPQAKQTEFTRRAVGLLVTAFRTGVYNLPVLWKRVDWRYGNGVSFVLGNRPALASWDFNQLTRLVIGAHDECIRIEVEPHGFGYLRINMWPRKGRDGAVHERHPSIEQAITDYRNDNPAPAPNVLLRTLRRIAGQSLSSEIGDGLVANDIEGTHDAMILEARAALAGTEADHG
ncbi:MAG TPA: hypothetical protein VL202_00325 [Pararhizobium sp.]|uniref:hypothetical protein n=1 Tax=Pararhizobium sp. TaxID=1977563 RepID=UPI002BB95E0D|nr:hypothetical protein [Pararhizobium sp.]HTO29615.1 hypothetical protein [Pararhizobium sp.]